MPFDYDAKVKQFTQRGKAIPLTTVRKEIDGLTAGIAKEAEAIARRYTAGQITLAQFEREMQAVLKSGHIIAAGVGKGGYARMTTADWNAVGTRLNREYGYLGKMVKKIGRGKIAADLTPYRAKKYANGVVMSWHETMRTEHTRDSVTTIKVMLIQNSKEGCEECNADADRGWVAVEDMAEIGTRICGNFCRCYLDFSDDAERRGGLK